MVSQWPEFYPELQYLLYVLWKCSHLPDLNFLDFKIELFHSLSDLADV